MAAVFEMGDESTETCSQVTYENKIFHKVDNCNHVKNKESDWLSLEGIKPTTQTEQTHHQNHGENFLNCKSVSKTQSGSENMISNGVVCSMKEFPQNSWDKTCKFSKKTNCQIELDGKSSTETESLSKLQEEESIETEVPSTCKSPFDTWENTILKTENSTKDTESRKTLNVSTDASKQANHFKTCGFKDDLKMECEKPVTETALSQQHKAGQSSPKINSTLEEKSFTPNFTDEIVKTSGSSLLLNPEHIYSKTDNRAKSVLDTSLSNAHQLAENEENVSNLESKTTKNCLENNLSERRAESAEKQPNPDRCSNISKLRKHCTPCQVIVQDFFKELNIDLVELSRNFPVKHIQKRPPGRPSLLRRTDISQNRFFHDGGQEMTGDGANKTNNGVKTKRKPGRKCKKLTDKRKQAFFDGMASSGNFSDFMEDQEEYKVEDDSREKHFGVVSVDDDDDEEEDNLPLVSVKNNLHQTRISALLRNNLENSPACETKKYNNVTRNMDLEKKTAYTIPSSTTVINIETQQSGSPKRSLTKRVIPGNIEAASSLGIVAISPHISESTNNISSATNANVTANPPVATTADDDEATIFITNAESNSITVATNNTNTTNSAISSSSSSFSSSFPVNPVMLTPTTENRDIAQSAEETEKRSKDDAQPKPNDKVDKLFPTNLTTVNNNRSHCENLNVKPSAQRCVSSTKPKCKYHGLNSAPCRKLFKCKKCGLEAKCLSDIQAHMGGTHSEFCMYRCPYCVPRNRVKTINSIEFEVLRSSNTNVSSQSSVKKKAPCYTSNNNSSSSSSSSTNNNNNNSNSSSSSNNKKKKVNHHIQLQREKKRKLNYYYRNQHEIKKYKNTKITCEYCRKLVNQSNISRHLNSKSCKGLKKNTEKQNVNGKEAIVIKKYQKVKCNTCQKHISRTNLSKHCRICPKENLHD